MLPKEICRASFGFLRVVGVAEPETRGRFFKNQSCNFIKNGSLKLDYVIKYDIF